MRPSLFLVLLFSALGLIALGLGFAFGWAILNAQGPEFLQGALLIGAAGLFVFLMALVGVWALLHLRIVQPIEALTREVQTLTHAQKIRQIELPEGHMTGGLGETVQELIAKFIEARTERQEAIDAALERGDTYKRRLETILLDLSEGVIVCNLDNRVLLYNQAAMRILNRPESLGLGRRLFALFERDEILKALAELTEKQRADTTRKLRITRTVACKRVDGGETREAQLALICSDEIETEGYVLTFTPDAASLDDTDSTLPPRPEFYDFDLFKCPPDRDVLDILLKEIRYVVFDTETTGLSPSKGDEIVSIGAIRIVNNRIVRGEAFEQLIHPGRKIPKASIRFHGITDEHVKGKPKAHDVLPHFHRFCGRAVLVAHNAAFDMKFLELKEKVSGVSFANPVLDVLLLSAFLYDHAEDHSLGATAERFGVDVSDRHSALGDAMTTGAILLAMLGPLEERGVVTLGDALKVSSKQVKIRKMQARF
ncbi:MAG: PAS domain-containing protein [Hyphomicrobiaceae bacterium]|nr:PAS domain-containing protein [Hyphomicrobiaceae bacterium]